MSEALEMAIEAFHNVYDGAEFASVDRAIKAAIDEYIRQHDDWRAIETAPKDGAVIWAYHPRGALGGLDPACRAVAWNAKHGVWMTDSCYGGACEGSTGFTLWRPLPEPPK
jgi:hypothetical protein